MHVCKECIHCKRDSWFQLEYYALVCKAYRDKITGKPEMCCTARIFLEDTPGHCVKYEAKRK